MMAILKQKNGAPMAFERQAVVIYAAVNGYLERVAVNRVGEFEEKFLNFLDSSANHVLESIARGKDIASQTDAELKEQLKKFEETHPDLFQGDTLTPGLLKVSPYSYGRPKANKN